MEEGTSGDSLPSKIVPISSLMSVVRDSGESIIEPGVDSTNLSGKIKTCACFTFLNYGAIIKSFTIFRSHPYHPSRESDLKVIMRHKEFVREITYAYASHN